MAYLPKNRSISQEHVPDMEDWAVPLLEVINGNAETLYDALNRDIEFDKNVASQIKEMHFTTPADYSSDEFPVLKFKSTLRRKAQGVMILQLHYRYNPTTPMYATVGAPQWLEINNNIEILWIGGLANDTEYTVKLLVI